MQLFKVLLLTCIVLTVWSSAALASDFSWTRNFNRQAMADPPEFMAKFAVRFDLSEMQVIALRNIFASPADAYIMLRLGEIQGDLKRISREQAIEAVNLYRSSRQKGWDALAERLGVEPGSEEYKALKRDHDMHGDSTRNQVAYNGREPGNAGF